MSIIVFASPPTPTPPEPVAWTHHTHTWQAWDGTVWDLSHGTMGALLLEGVRGLDMPDDITHYRGSSPAVHGSWWRGLHIGPREVFWPLRLRAAESSQAWKDLRRRWWRGLQPWRTGTWQVTHPDGETRTLRCRFADDSQAARTIAPELIGRSVTGIRLIADDPFWQGPPVERSFGAPVTGLLFGGDDPDDPGAVEAGPPLFISQAFAADTVSNPGDVAAWPVWRLHGPLTAATVGVGDQVVTFPHSIAAGDWVQIDTDPRVQTAVDSTGNDRTAHLGAAGFAPVPAGEDVTLVVSLTGAGHAVVTITPAYLQAD